MYVTFLGSLAYQRYDFTTICLFGQVKLPTLSIFVLAVKRTIFILFALIGCGESPLIAVETNAGGATQENRQDEKSRFDECVTMEEIGERVFCLLTDGTYLELLKNDLVK